MLIVRLLSIAFLLMFVSNNVVAGSSYGRTQLAFASQKIEGVKAKNIAGISLIIKSSIDLNNAISIPGFSLEGQYASPITPIKTQNVTARNGSGQMITQQRKTVSYRNTAIYLAYTQLLSNKTSVKWRSGVVRSSSSYELSSVCDAEGVGCDNAKTKFSVNRLGITFGAAISYAITEKISAIVELTKTFSRIKHDDISSMRVGAGVMIAFEL